MATATPVRRIVGLVAGAALGLLAGFLFVWGYTTLDLPRWNDPKALDLLLTSCAIGLLGGGAIGATRLAHARTPVLVAVAVIAGAALLLLVGFLVGSQPAG